MSKIIITTTDTRANAEFLQSVLQSYFGKENVVIGLESFITAPEFTSSDVQQAITQAKAILVLIGDNWLQSGWANDITHPLRIALTSALSQNKPLLVVSVANAPLPPANTLPLPLAPLAERIPLSLRDANKRSDSIAIANLLEGFFTKDVIVSSPFSVQVTTKTKLELASGWDRFGAYGIDGMILSGINILLNNITLSRLYDTSESGTFLAYFIINFLFVFAYEVASNYFGGQTLGKIIFRTRVVRTNGQSLRFSDAVLRASGYYISAIGFGCGFLWALIDEKRQGWHDKIAQTVVIKKR